MNLKQVVDSIYIIPVLLDHMVNPTDLTIRILAENGISEVQVNEFKEVKDLLLYHLSFVFKMEASSEADYTLLRKALKQYFDAYLSQMFQKLGTVNELWDVLDYGCGSGQVGTQFKKDNLFSTVYFLDRKNEFNLPNFWEVDFEEKPHWHAQVMGMFDCVLMSELLHCKSAEGQAYLIDSAHRLLNETGKLIIIENVDWCMAYRISKIKDETVNIITGPYLEILTLGKFKLTKYTSILQHNIYFYERI